MAFEIHSPSGGAIPINTLDLEASIFWRVSLKAKRYANPGPRWEISWFDSIGYAISSPKARWSEKEWENVKNTLWSIQMTGVFQYMFHNPDDPTNVGDEMIEQIRQTQVFLKPYFDLIDYWASKGYIPVQVKD